MDMAPDLSGLALIGILLIVGMVLSLVALILGGYSLLLLVVRRPGVRRRGLRLALIAVMLGILAGAVGFVIHSPPHSPHPGFLSYLLLFPLQIGLCGVIFWGLTGSRRVSGTGRLAIAILAIGFPMGAVRGIHRWERRRWLLEGAEVWTKHAHDGEARTAVQARRALDETGASARVARDLSNQERLWAQHSAEMARAFRWAADHPEEALPDVPEPDWRR